MPNINEQGGVTIRVQAIDNAGNVSQWSDPVHYYYDATAPLAPTANPVGGDFYNQTTIDVELSAELGAEIRYTLDGNDPTSTTGSVYTDPITLATDTTVKAIAIDKAGNVSPVMNEVYEIAPVISTESDARVNDSTVTISWITDDPSTSRVVYDIVPHDILGGAPNYGYAYSTIEDSTKVTSHSVKISSLTVGTTYYYRVISHGSPEAVGKEYSYTPYLVYGLAGDGRSDGLSDGKSSGAGVGGGVLGVSIQLPSAFQSVLGVQTEEAEETKQELKDESAKTTPSVTPEVIEQSVLGDSTNIFRTLAWTLLGLLILFLIIFFILKRKKRIINS